MYYSMLVCFMILLLLVSFQCRFFLAALFFMDGNDICASIYHKNKNARFDVGTRIHIVHYVKIHGNALVNVY